MKQVIVESSQGVTLAGGGPFGAQMLAKALDLAPRLVAADGGADRLLRLGAEPEAVIGDFDSIRAKTKARLAGRLFPILEQETTDFDKALRSIAAPFVLGIGFVGARVDHGLAVLNALTRHPDKRCLILGPKDITFLCPPDLRLDLPLGSAFSLFPMGEARASSEGLRWPVQGIDLAPDGMIGTSNMVSGPVRVQTATPKLLCIVPLKSLGCVLTGLLRPSSAHDE